MSKLVVITYTFLILLQSININIEDFSKLSVLLEHANYHKEMYGDSFLEFISEHYGDQTLSHGENHDEHKKLPFKEHHHMLCQVNAVFILTSTLTSPLNCQSFTEIPLNFFYKESISLFEKPSVFQPPKFA